MSMVDASRRDAFKMMLAGVAAAPFSLRAAAAVACGPGLGTAVRWRAGIEGQRRADLGDGTYLNPIVAGDHPDPTILKDGNDYYMTFTPFQACPGLVIWHSTDLLDWTPLTAALNKPLGTSLRWTCANALANTSSIFLQPSTAGTGRST
jgi:xylan 1,4-beta-xylosidase